MGSEGRRHLQLGIYNGSPHQARLRVLQFAQPQQGICAWINDDGWITLSVNQSAALARLEAEPMDVRSIQPLLLQYLQQPVARVIVTHG